MRKSKAIIFAAILTALSAATVYAEPLVAITDAENNGINISGPASVQDKVTLMILNPGFSEADAENGTDGAVQFFRSYKADGGYSFDVNLKIDDSYDGGLFTAVVNAGGKKETAEFSLYPVTAKLDLVQMLNASAVSASMVEEVAEKFSLSQTKLYINGDKTAIAKAIENIKSTLPDGKFPEDADAVYSYLRQAFLCAAYNSSIEEAVIADGKLLYADSILEISETESYTDYISNLNAAGVNGVNNSLLSGNYETIDDIKEAFNDYVALYAITEYKQNGYGHVSGYLDKYAEIYKENGFDLSKPSSLSNKNDFYNKLATSNAKTLSALANEFNNYTEKTGVSNTGNSGSGGSGGSGGSVGSGATVSSKPGNVNNYVPKEPFSDLGNVEWAKEAIEYLYNNGVVSGKQNGIFAPNDSVTRAEFVKMVVGAFKLTASDNVKSFSDVAESDWFSEYVKTASSLGIVSGVTDELFMPYELVTREQAAKILLYTAKNAGIITAVNTSMPFADDGEIAEYAKESVYTLKAAGVISGRENNMFAPKAGMTRAEGAKMIYGLVKR